MRDITDKPLLRADQQLKTFSHVVEVFDQLPNFVELRRTFAGSRLEVSGGDPLCRSAKARNWTSEITRQQSANKTGNDDGQRKPFQNGTTPERRLDATQFKDGEIARGFAFQQTGDTETLLVDGSESYCAWLRKRRKIHLAMARITKHISAGVKQIERHASGLDRALACQQRGTSSALIGAN